MKTFLKIFKITFIIALICSVVLSVSILVSTSFKMVLEDDLTSRERIVNKTLVSVNSGQANKKLSLSYSYYLEESTFVVETVSCYVEKDQTKYSWLEKVYQVDKEGNKTLVRTSFSLGDYFKYVTDGSSKVKELYKGEALDVKMSKFIDEFKKILPFMVDVSDEDNQKFVEHSVSLDFNFNAFTLNRNVAYVGIEDNKATHLNFVIDNKDRITSAYTDKGEGYSIKYENYKLALPSTDEYTAG